MLKNIQEMTQQAMQKAAETSQQTINAIGDNSVVKNIQEVTQQTIQKATETSQQTMNLTGAMTEGAITMIVDKTIETLHIAAKRIQEKELSAKTVTIGASANMGVIEFNITMEIPTESPLKTEDQTQNILPLLPNGEDSVEPTSDPQPLT